MTEPEWKGHVLFRGNRVLGWVNYVPAPQYWYARTAGTIDNPMVRAEFDNEESARDFLMFLANSENQ